MTTWETLSTRFSPVKTCANRHGHRTRAGDDSHHVPQQNGTQMKTNITHFTIIIHHQWWSMSIPGTECHPPYAMHRITQVLRLPFMSCKWGLKTKGSFCKLWILLSSLLVEKAEEASTGCLLGGRHENILKKGRFPLIPLLLVPGFRNYLTGQKYVRHQLMARSEIANLLGSKASGFHQNLYVFTPLKSEKYLAKVELDSMSFPKVRGEHFFLMKPTS